VEFHEAAKIFPMMTVTEYDQLKADISANGLLEPIVIYNGLILDGRNRYLACTDLGITPEYETFDGGDPVSFVISKNLHRRHLTASQRAMIAIDVLPMFEAEAKKRQESTRFGGGGNISTTYAKTGKSRDKAGAKFGVSGKYVAEAEKVKQEAPELVQHILDGNLTLAEAKKKSEKKQRETVRQKLAESVVEIPISDKFHIETGNIETYETNKKFDFIITDPPYPKEYLSLYETLAIKSKEWLKPGGLLIAMCGQSYLNQIYEMMSKHIDYYWTAAYLTPGQSASLWQKNVIPKWKPLLIFSVGKYNGKMFGDVYESGANEKDFHKWGQSISGMYSIISGICLPGQSIFDPFCGAGTTGIAALKHGCLFDGIDIDEENVNVSIRRIYDSTAKR
jgi:hypothetical protein